MKGRFLQFGGRIFFHKLTNTANTDSGTYTENTALFLQDTCHWCCDYCHFLLLFAFIATTRHSHSHYTTIDLSLSFLCSTHFPFILLFFVPFCFVSCFTFYYSMYVYRILFLSFCFSFFQCLCLFHSLLRALTLHLCLHSLVLSLSLLYTSIKVCIFISQLCLLFPFLFTFSLTSPSPFLTFAFPLLTSTQARPSVEFQLIFNLNWRLHHSTTVNINYNGSTQAGTAHCCSIHHFKSGVCVLLVQTTHPPPPPPLVLPFSEICSNKSLQKMKCSVVQ